MITGFDHFVVIVSGLDPAMETYHTLGFDVQPGGEHPRFGSHNAIVPLADSSYIELVAFKDKELASKTFWGDAVRKLEAGEGFAGFVLSSDDLAADVAEIRKRSLAIDDPSAGTRTRPDGQRVAWHTAVVGGTTAGVLPFLIQDDTPREVRCAPAQAGLGSHARSKEVIVAVKNIESARQSYRELLDIEPRFVHNTAGDLDGYRVNAKWGSVIIAHPERKGNAMYDQLSARGQGLYALTLSVDNVNQARSDIVRKQIRVEDDPVGFLILPEYSCGARIRLVQA